MVEANYRFYLWSWTDTPLKIECHLQSFTGRKGGKHRFDQIYTSENEEWRFSLGWWEGWQNALLLQLNTFVTACPHINVLLDPGCHKKTREKTDTWWTSGSLLTPPLLGDTICVGSKLLHLLFSLIDFTASLILRCRFLVVALTLF